MGKTLIAAILSMLVAGSALSAQVTCSLCGPITMGGDFNDLCTTVVVTYQQFDGGDCVWNPQPKCIAHVNCVFSMTVTITDKGCGALYWNRYCTQLVDAWGNPVGGEACAAPTPFPNPLIVSGYPIPCGQRATFKFERTIAPGPTVAISQPGGTCTACSPAIQGH